VLSERPTGVQEASAVAPLPGGRFLLVDDEKGIFRWDDDAATRLEAGVGLKDLEGICVSHDGSEAFVLSERDGAVWHFALADGELSQGHRLGALPRLNRRRNQGWEGISHVATGFFADAPELVAVHQTKPQQVGFFDAATLEPHALLRLPKRARKRLGDLNDVTVLPDSRHLMVVSGKTGLLAELTLKKGKLELLRLYRIATSKHDVPEGLAAAGLRRLWLVTDGEGMLRELQLDN